MAREIFGNGGYAMGQKRNRKTFEKANVFSMETDTAQLF
jgi:hypothetical protein